MIKPFLKIIALILIVSLNWLGFLAIGKTFASFSDLEISEGNSFSAAILDFALHSGQDNFVPESKSLNMQPGDEVNRVIQIRSEGLLVFQYTAWTEKISGDDDFCNALQLEADLEGTEIYNGNLMDFNFSPVEISDSVDTWHFKASLPENSSFQDKTCQIKFVFNGWQTNFLDPSSGFFDQEEIESYFADQVDLASDSDSEESAEEPISEENPEQQNENVGQPVDNPEEQPTTEATENSSGGESQPLAGGGDSETQPPTDVQSDEESTVEETPVVEEPIIEESSIIEEETSGTSENNQNGNQANEGISSEPATTPDETQIQSPTDSPGNSQETIPETNDSSGDSSQENSSQNVDTITVPESL